MGDLFVQTQDKLDLFVSSAGNQDGPTVIFSAPLTGTTVMWEDALALLPEGLRTVCYDTRGFGQSDASVDFYDIARLGNDVVAIMDALDVDRAIFCGVSLGGLVGIWLGANHPHRFSGMILANTAPDFPPPSIWQDRAAEAARLGMAGLIEPTLDRWFTREFRLRNPARMAKIAAMIGSANPPSYVACCNVLETTHLAERLGEISCPVLVIVGKRDLSTPPARGDQMVKNLANARIISLDASHMPVVELPDAFAEAVARFIDATSAATWCAEEFE